MCAQLSGRQGKRLVPGLFTQLAQRLVLFSETTSTCARVVDDSQRNTNRLDGY